MLFGKKKQKIDKKYVEEKALQTTEEDIVEVEHNEERIASKISESGMLEKYTELGKLMLRMLKDYRRGLYKEVPWFTIASIVFSLLYVLNPFDLVPDFIPGLGYLDDLSVLGFAVKFIETDLHSYLDWKLDQDNAEPEVA